MNRFQYAKFQHLCSRAVLREMSNIQDITTLSDLLTTSPSQQTQQQTLSRSEAVKTQAKDVNSSPEEGDDSNSKHRTAELVEYKETNNDDNEADETMGNGKGDQELAGPRSSQLSEFEELLDREGYKLELTNERSTLLKKRALLQSEIDEQRSVFRQLQKEKAEELINAKVKKLLEDNDNVYFEQEGSLSENNDDEGIISELHVLPSNDWVKRLQCVNRFLPHIEFDNLKTFNAYEEGGQLVRYIQFKLMSPLVFRSKIQVRVDTTNESVKKVELIDPDSFMVVNLISQPFALLMSKYLAHKKLNLFIYGMNSLCTELHRRIETMSRLIEKYRDMIVNDTLRVLYDDATSPTRFELYVKLKTVSTLDFELKGKTISMVWELIPGSKILGECRSEIKLYINSQGKVMPIKGLFTSLISQYGVENAFDTILKNFLSTDV